MTLKEQVEYILAGDKNARNYDSWLIAKLYIKFYPELIEETPSGEYKVTFGNMWELPKQSSIERWRRKIQETKYQPTLENVAKRRKLNIVEWRKALGYHTNNLT